jgi:hypothetical protein
MMIDRLTHKPLPVDRKAPGDFTDLQQSARVEEQQMASRLEAGPASGYRVRRVVVDPGRR